MAKGKNQRLKILKLYEYLKYNSDKSHPCTMKEILKALNDQGIDCERKTISADIDALIEADYNVVKDKYKYYLEGQGLNVEQLRFLMDATQSAAFLTPVQTEQICNAVAELAGEHKAELVGDQVVYFEKVKHDNDEVLDTVRQINHAVELDCKVSFRYFSTGLGGVRNYRKNGARYVENPICLVFNDGLYYLICYNEKYNDMVIYRVDRISDMKIERKKAIKHTDKDGQIYNGNIKDRLTAFGMWHNEAKKVKLLVHNKYVEEMYDKFGRDIYTRPYDSEHFTFTEKISVSSVFFGWVASFGTDVKILEPADVKDEFIEKMKEIYENY